ncbi:MAG: hypothetical protein V7L04_14155 [Nostoc sp.]|uniref:hypothetical protein n=1 Tax=Nostoc sp. TaxID=1180 RepID=UPI002FF62C9E
MTIQTGYAIANIAALKALTSSQRIDGYSRLVKSDAKSNPAWYTFISTSTATPDDNLVVLPSDNPSAGRWIKSSGSATGGGVAFGGANLCNSGCTIGTKAFEFYAPQTNLELIIQVGFGISITAGSKSIQIYGWSQQPNTSLNGRQFIAEIANTGGKIIIPTLDSTHKWLSIFAKNPAKSGQFDGVCFTVTGNVITLIGYS